MKESVRPIVYVSYSYDAEKNIPLLEELKKTCTNNGFDFRCDTEKLRYGESFDQFMGEVERSKHVIVIASPKYFNSFYCMTELAKIYREGEIRTRLIPIWIDEVKVDKSTYQEQVVKFWDNIHSQLENEGKSNLEAANLDGVKFIKGNLPDCLKSFGSLRALLHDEDKFKEESYRQDFLRKIARRVLFPLGGNGNKGITRSEDSQFQKNIEDKVKTLLDKAPQEFQQALIEELEEKQELATADLAKKLCEAADGDCYEVIEYILFDAVQNAHKKCTSDHKSLLIEVAKEIVSCLILFSVEDDWIKDWSAESQITNMRMDLEVETTSAALIITSRLHQKVPKFLFEHGSTSLRGKDEFTIPKKPSGTDAKRNVDMVIQHIWGQVNPDNKDKPLGKDDVAELNRQLERLYRRGFKQHYICNAGTDYDYIADYNVLYGIQKYLPSLVILLLEGESGTKQVAIHNDRKLTGALRDFLKHVHELGHNK
ncbi:MAG: toll/interleukin-1 receptor domain-containing protein [Thiotrichaceae bacterium]